MLFHGTGIEPLRVAREGLRPIDIRATIDEVRRAYRLGPEFMRAPGVADAIARKRAHRHVYLTDDYAEAASYAEAGGNFRALLEIEAARLCGRRWRRPGGGYVYAVGLDGTGEVRRSHVAPDLLLGYQVLA